MATHNGADITMVEMDAEVLPNIELYGIDPEGPVPQKIMEKLKSMTFRTHFLHMFFRSSDQQSIP